MVTSEHLKVLFLFLGGWVDPQKIKTTLELTDEEFNEAIKLIEEEGYTIDLRTIH